MYEYYAFFVCLFEKSGELFAFDTFHFILHHHSSFLLVVVVQLIVANHLLNSCFLSEDSPLLTPLIHHLLLLGFCISF